MRRTETRSHTMTLRLTPTLRAALDALAQEDRRTLSTYVILLLERHVASQPRPMAKTRPASKRDSGTGT